MSVLGIYNLMTCGKHPNPQYQKVSNIPSSASASPRKTMPSHYIAHNNGRITSIKDPKTHPPQPFMAQYPHKA
jgi:hypothetical protein